MYKYGYMNMYMWTYAYYVYNTYTNVYNTNIHNIYTHISIYICIHNTLISFDIYIHFCGTLNYNTHLPFFI